MTVPRIQYDGDGTTTDFAFPFLVFEDDEVAVWVDDGLVDRADYTVALLEVGGTVLFDTAPADGTVVTLVCARSRPSAARPTSSRARSAPPSSTPSSTALVAVLDQIEDKIARALVLADTDTATGFAALPAKADLAGKLLGFDDDGEPVATDPVVSSEAAARPRSTPTTPAISPTRATSTPRPAAPASASSGSTICVTYGTTASSACVGNDARLSDARTPTAHTHDAGDLTDEGDFYAKTRGTGLGLSGGDDLVTYGTSASTACVGNDARLSDARTPTAHTHDAGDLTDEGDFYAKTRGTGLDDAAGTISVAYGTSSSSACAGDDARLSDQREPSVYDILCGIAGARRRRRDGAAVRRPARLAHRHRRARAATSRPAPPRPGRACSRSRRTARSSAPRPSPRRGPPPRSRAPRPTSPPATCSRSWRPPRPTRRSPTSPSPWPGRCL